MTPQITLALTPVLLCGTSLTDQDQDQVNVTVNSTMDIYRAGGYYDKSNGIAPLDLAFAAKALRTISFPSVSGAWTCQDGYPTYGPDGATSGYCVTAGGGPTNFDTIGCQYFHARRCDFT